MAYLSTTAIRKMQDLSWQLGACHSEREVEAAAVRWLFEAFGGSTAALTDYPACPGPMRLQIVPSEIDAGEIERNVQLHFAQDGRSDHPLVCHFFYQWRDLTPVRMSDLLSDLELRSTRAYSEVFRAAGFTHQIAMVSRRESVTDNAGYAVTRKNRDFTDAELDLTIALQPLLFAIHQSMRVKQPDWGPAAERARLTQSELDILGLVATGMTAVAIGHLRRISPRTVRKHLESVYTKLGRHDRLQAVTYARDIGLIPRLPQETADDRRN